MECNKDEAIKAKEIALKKMQSNDFNGAQKMASKAQLLFPGLENITQLLAVCDVHCSAQNRILGTEKDWYGILQLERKVDEVTIKKQYRKLALVLHPDKNQFPGAESAFKLIGEAHLVLSDKGKKAIYDSKIVAMSKSTNIPSTWRRNGVHESMVNGGFTRFNVQKNPPQATQFNANNSLLQRFWTSCPFCKINYQYHREFVNMAVTCQNCKKSFIAFDIGVPPGSNRAHVVPQGVPIPPRSTYQSQATSQGVSSIFNNKPQASNIGKSCNSNLDGESSNGVEPPRAYQKKPVEDRGKNEKKKRKRKSKSKSKSKSNDEPSESSDTESSSDSEEVNVDTEAAQKFESDGLYMPRRSSRTKHNVSYVEPQGDDDNGGDQGVETINVSDSDSESESESESCSVKYDCPDPEFNNFDKLREENCFRVDQLWACYGDSDSMPRFYAQVKKVCSSPFMVRINWLEFKPADSLSSDWDKCGLPISCGNYKRGSRDTVSLLTFSHQIVCDKRKGTFIIYPRKGTVWALFRDWDSGWVNESTRPKTYTYDIVEVLSEFSQVDGIQVTSLEKVKEFVSIFHRNSDGIISIAPNEMLRFSHEIPSFKMRGDEKDGVPIGSFELDTASVSLEQEV